MTYRTADWYRQYRAERAGQTPHGTNNGYVNHGCRCHGCRSAHAREMNRWRMTQSVTVSSDAIAAAKASLPGDA